MVILGTRSLVKSETTTEASSLNSPKVPNNTKAAGTLPLSLPPHSITAEEPIVARGI